jgi:hypothetical protein
MCFGARVGEIEEEITTAREIEQGEPGGLEMQVMILERWQERAAGEVHTSRLRSTPRLYLFASAECDYAAAGDSERIDGRTVCIEGDDVTAVKEEVRVPAVHLLSAAG